MKTSGISNCIENKYSQSILLRSLDRHWLGLLPSDRIGPGYSSRASQFSERLLCRRLAVAYSLNDVYRYLRLVMRINGVVVGLGLGLLLVVSSRGGLSAWGVFEAGPIWPVRLAGGLLITFGVMLILSAGERIVGGPSMVAMSLGNSVVALVLLVAYLQRDLATLSLFGRLLLIVVFIACLLGALFPLQYLRAEYRSP
jgi:hypothetical protein